MVKSNHWRLIPVVYIIGGIFVPLIFLFVFSGGIEISAIAENKNVIFFTIKQALISSIFTMLLGLPGAYLVARTKMKKILKSIFRVLSSVPFILPGVTMSIGFLLAFGKNGLITKILSLFGYKERILYTFVAVILGHVFYNFPLFIRIVGETWERIDGTLIEAGKIDGANKFKIFVFVELPNLIPSILKSFLLTYVYTFTSFAVVLILGGIKYSTIEVSIYMYTRILFDFKSAFTLAVFQMLLISFIAYFLNLKTSEFISGVSLKEKFPIWGYFYFGVTVFFIFIPLIYSLLSGFLNYAGGFGVENFKRLFSLNLSQFIGTNFYSLVFYSIFLPAIASIITIFISSIASYYSVRGRKIDYLIIIPAAISPVTIAFSYVLMRFSPLFSLILIYSLISIPIVFGFMESGWRTINFEIEEAAVLDGANGWVINTKVRFPLIKYHILTAFIYAFTIALGEMSATITISEPPISTFSIAIYRLLSSRRIPEARALNSIYGFIVIILFSTLEYLRNKEK
ncbi:ABC transporter permease [Thermosipho atlanticus]|uniref:Thiamine transport system permease protein n=1 Tax=Thermosipho atlanticus DSM 15807 TaxID=1123380 RepID=A0A1M5SR11_9BACT|nr:iron ABC transporter permease [Thermosipho atlanticus]SHH40413.1 thiamine transport system permease protein [Thermosipho atlanticus DSM 15807]